MTVLKKLIPGALKRGVRSQYALDKFIEVCRANNVSGRCLDLGCGNGLYYHKLVGAGVFDRVTGMDLDPASKERIGEDFISADFVTHDFGEPLDAIWCAHVLEHLRNPGEFIDKIRSCLRPGGVLCLSVPPFRQRITVGHVTQWTPGLLLLNLAKAGFDCSDIKIKQQGYNIAAVLVNRDGIENGSTFNPDVPKSLRPYLPAGLSWNASTLHRDQHQPANKRTVLRFKGNFRQLNWG